MRLSIAVMAVALAVPVAAQDHKNDWIDMLAIALQQTTLTLPGSKPFHLKAEIIESTNPDSGYQGTFEEYWVSPEKWRWRIGEPGVFTDEGREWRQGFGTGYWRLFPLVAEQFNYGDARPLAQVRDAESYQ